MTMMGKRWARPGALTMVSCREGEGGDDVGDDGPATYIVVRCHGCGELKVSMWVQESWGVSRQVRRNRQLVLEDRLRLLSVSARLRMGVL